MNRAYQLIMIFIFSVLLTADVYTQTSEPARKFNELYEPLPVILRLSYENFKNIKLLNTAIINFGGGESEFDKLVEEYAEASSLFFRNDLIESANKFTENEKNIKETAFNIAKKYKKVTEDLQTNAIKMKVKASIKMQLSGKNVSLTPSVQEAILNGGYSLGKANDNFVRTHYVNSIYLYRRAKENLFSAYSIAENQYKKLADDSVKFGKKGDREYYLREAEKHKLPSNYEKDIVDNKNKVYAKEDRQKDK